MKRIAVLCAAALLSAPCAWSAEAKPTEKEPEPSFTAPAIQMRFNPFFPGREPETPGSRARTSRLQIPRANRGEPMSITIPRKGGTTLQAEAKGRRLLTVDVNGDKRYSGKAENLNLSQAGYFGPTHAVVKWPDGTRNYYGFVVYPPPKGSTSTEHYLERYCAMVGKVGTTPVQLIDDNSNGLYNEYGVDVIIIGKKPPVLLGKMAILGGELHHMKVSPAGHKLYLAKYLGKTGKVDLLSGYKAPMGVKLRSVALKSGDKVFDCLGDKKTPKVSIPEGKYELSSAMVGRSTFNVAVLPGRMEALEIKGGVPPAELKWGAPFTIGFKSQSKIMGITLTEIGLYGAGGEMYLTPKEKPPVAIVYKGTMPVHRGTLKYRPDGTLDDFFFDPRKSGNYTIEILQRSAVFGKVTSGKVKVKYDKAF